MANQKAKKDGRFKGFVLRFKYLVIGVLAGAILGAFGVVFWQNYNPPDVLDESQIVAASVVFERIQSQNELVSASQQYNITEKASKSNKIPFTDVSIPFTENSYWYRYVGTIKASVDLSTASFKARGNKITVTLDQPKISSNTPDMKKSGVLEEHNNVFNPITIQDFDEFRRKCQKQGKTEAIKGGILDEAKVAAEDNIRGMFFAAMGEEYEIEFKWRKS